jgi:hypothetical protein
VSCAARVHAPSGSACSSLAAAEVPPTHPVAG